MLEGQRANANIMAEVAGDAQRAAVLSTQFSTGFAGNFRVALGNLLETSGVNTIVTDTLKALGYENVDQKKLTDLLGGDIPAGQTLDSVGKRIAINLAESFPGNLNKEEVNIITSVGPSLLKTPKAIQLITKIFSNAAERSRTVLDDANKLIIRGYFGNVLQDNGWERSYHEAYLVENWNINRKGLMGIVYFPFSLDDDLTWALNGEDSRLVVLDMELKKAS